MLEARSPESHTHAHAQEMVRVRLEDLIERTGLSCRRGLARCPAAGFQFRTALVPEHRHECQDEVRLIELLAFAIDAHENVGHLFFGALLRQLERNEGEVGQGGQLADSVGDFLFFGVGHRAGSCEALQIFADGFMGGPAEYLGDVENVLRVPFRGCVGNDKSAALRPEGDADALLWHWPRQKVVECQADQFDQARCRRSGRRGCNGLL
ncbi:hypothetical protein [Paraburkholderia phenoliruptrix]|uniref:hypothetical protein n=1 Tax=Paraburkholderia phenoliruptrix TaxID=252970 RepID=UPI001C6E7E74|nr:hypothetical protein [Paraburkholderia phenoliruptrix]MBW9107867.1 hypothetical protein [Paraburkholderia phenoliruptrix]MBW9133112.1 hypothetical protein [Paraburkholderia ginsengiterrae]